MAGGSGILFDNETSPRGGAFQEIPRGTRDVQGHTGGGAPPVRCAARIPAGPFSILAADAACVTSRAPAPRAAPRASDGDAGPQSARSLAAAPVATAGQGLSAPPLPETRFLVAAVAASPAPRPLAGVAERITWVIGLIERLNREDRLSRSGA